MLPTSENAYLLGTWVVSVVDTSLTLTRANNGEWEQRGKAQFWLIYAGLRATANTGEGFAPHSHGRGRWFEPSIAHSKKTCKRARNVDTSAIALGLSAATIPSARGMGSIFEPLGDEPLARVYVYLPQPPSTGVHELVRHAGRHHHDLAAAHLDDFVPRLERGAASCTTKTSP
jgi:hypothetical protein